MRARSVSVCIFVKPPLPGVAKTRLAPTLGEEAAARLARAFFLDTLSLVRSLEWAQPIVATLGPLPGDLAVPADVPTWMQEGADLGARIEHVLERAVARGQPAIALGVDTPGLPTSFLTDAAHALVEADAVLGPTLDGGFYALGVRAWRRGLLAGIPWSDRTTCERTRARLEEEGWRVRLAKTWYDVDVPGDLARLRADLEQGSSFAAHTKAVLEELEDRRI